MKLMKKALSVFMAVLMIFSAMSISFTSFAADADLKESYKNFAYSFFNYTKDSSTGANVITKDEAGIPSLTILGDMSHYTTSTGSGSYKYEDEEGGSGAIRSVAYSHFVTAKDDGNYTIRSATNILLGIVDNIISYEYGVGLYTIPMLIDEITKEVSFAKGADGEYIFLDGYTYYVNIVGDIVARSKDKTYTVEDDGDIVYDTVVADETDEEAAKLQELVENGTYTAKTLLDICDVQSIIKYMCGNSTSVNSGNWFHEFKFIVKTDIETVLLAEGQNLKNANLNLYETTVEWSSARQFDDSGLKAQYYNLGYEKTETTSVSPIRVQLKNLDARLGQYFNKYYQGTVLDYATNSNLINVYYPDISKDLEIFNSISDAAKIAIFGQRAYSYVNLVTQLTPIAGPTTGDADQYAPVHTYDKYTDRYGNNVEFRVTTERMSSFISAIDGLLQNKAVTKVLGMFLDLSEFGIDLEANNNLTPQEAVILGIHNMLFTDDIVNMLIELIYPMVCNLLDDLITDQFIEDLLVGVVDGINLASIVDAVADNATSWNALIYGVLAQEAGVTLTPAGMAMCWNSYGYTTSAKYSFCDMQAMHDMLKAAKGGINNNGAGHNTGEYYAIGCQTEAPQYYMDHWKDVDWSKMVWNINGDQGKFLLALDAALTPLAPLLAILLGDAEADWAVIKVLLLQLRLILNEGDTFHLYNDVIAPLFETLGITSDEEGLISGEQFEANAKLLQSTSTRNAETVSTFLNDGLLNPLLNWITQELLGDPIQTVMSLLPNLSYFLTSGYVTAAVKGIEIPITLRIGNGGIKITVYTLSIGDLLGDALDFLDSVQGILDLISFGVDTGEGIVGYYSDAPGTNYEVFTPETEGYDPAVHNVPATVAYKSAYGLMNLYESGEYNQEIRAQDDEGNYTEYALRNDVGYYNTETLKIVDNIGARPELYVPLKEYYTYVVHDEYYDSDLNEIIYTSTTYKVRTLEEVPAEYKDVCEKVQSYITREEDISLPPIMDYKLQACGTYVTEYSARFGTFYSTDREGNTVTWGNHSRTYVQMTVSDKDGIHESYGLVFLFLLRYILSGVGYSQYENGEFVSKYTLLDAFGLGGDALTGELISGLGVTLGDIVYHICLNPDAIIAALMELLTGGEEGSLYSTKVVDNVVKVIAGKDYSYAPTEMETYAEEIIDAAELHNDFQYGTAVLYNEYWTEEDGEYVVDNLDDIAENVLAMLKLEDMESLSGLIENLLVENVFNNDMVTMIVDLVYSLLGGLEFDLGTILYEVLGVDYSKPALLDSIRAMFNEVDYTSIEMYQKLSEQVNKGNLEYVAGTFTNDSVDAETGEIITGESYDWGFNNPDVTSRYSSSEIFLRALSAAFGPFSVLVEFIFMGEDINLLDLVHIPMYEIYHYAWIPLMEALGATDGLISFGEYYELVFANPEGDVAGGASAFYWLLKPIVEFADNVVASPIETVLNLVPNLIFVLSIGGLNSIVNNIAHFAYVLLDILEPVIDVYPIIGKLLSNIDLGGIALNLSLPLNVDLNQLVNELLDGLLGSALSFEIENDNVVLGTQTVEKEVDVPVLDANGDQLYDVATGLPLTTKEMQMVTEEIYAVGVLNITLPYLDLTTLCSGEIQAKTSVAGYRYIYLNSSGGADFITLVFRLVTDTLFYKDNWENITNFLVGFCDLDDEDDNDALLMEILMFIHSKAQEARMNDILMALILTIYKVLVPIADTLGERFKYVDFSITDMFSDMDNIGTYVSALMDAGESKNETLSGFAKIIQMIKDFFANIAKFFSNLFG